MDRIVKEARGGEASKIDARRPLVVLTGPTAAGKTALSVRLAKRIKGEIISADSMQVYRHMDIGSAKIRQEEMEGVPHHMIDILEPWEEFNVVVFQRMVNQCLEEIYQRGNIPLLVGGTGFYIQAILYQIDFTENEENLLIRQRLEQLAAEKGSSFLYERLCQVDAAAAQVIHPNNRKRVIRALEFYELTGQKISQHNETERQKTAAYRSAYFVLTDDRASLYQKIDRRVDQMLEEGLIQEVESLRKQGCHREMVSMQGLGYKEILDYLEGKLTREQAVYLIKRDTRHFAKRQLTWFRREKEVIWLSKKDYQYDEDSILEQMLKRLSALDIWEQD
ncbi:MAG: tRNA (adenosine(37)-N6)-dimethylallyltransferase MiaA [Lachnospiraceae bacterium]|nr:tRNA (adenosine(37)-N6)-dimethylallyltransferase MiaA [Lachnospiraceae bacterium]